MSLLYEIQNGSNLYHYGVLGMKWGVRKEYESKGRQKSVGGSVDKIANNKYSDETVTTSYGDIKINNYDSDDYRDANLFLKLVDKQNPGRYADAKEAQKALDNLPKQKQWASENGQIILNNHDGPNDTRLNNCSHCSIAFEMRKRGYDVQAKEIYGGWADEAMHAFNVKDAFDIQFSKANTYDNKALAKEAYRQMEQKCLSYGDGARGSLAIQYANYDSGHSMYWVVENGEFRIIDSQKSGRDGYETFLLSDVVYNSVQVRRLDNADILPGVTDFVEAYEMTEEEKARKEKVAEKLKDSKKKSAEKKTESLKVAGEKDTKARDKQLWSEKSFLEKTKSVISNAAKRVKSYAKKAVSSFTKKNKDDGRSFVEKLFGIESKTTVTTVSSSNYKSH